MDYCLKLHLDTKKLFWVRLMSVIDSIYSTHEINSAFDKMDRAEQFGKIAINMDTFNHNL